MAFAITIIVFRRLCRMLCRRLIKVKRQTARESERGGKYARKIQIKRVHIPDFFRSVLMKNSNVRLCRAISLAFATALFFFDSGGGTNRTRTVRRIQFYAVPVREQKWKILQKLPK